MTIRNIGSYSIIKLGKRYEDGEFHTINFQRRNFGFDVFANNNYLGHENFGDAYSELSNAYKAGYKTIERVRL